MTDYDALQKKYDAERDKRLRADGSTQYIHTTGAYADLQNDPYADPAFEREAIEREVEVLIVGAGFGGMFSAVKLIDEGVDDFLILDQAADFGGTWYWNRYPGIQCDIESYCYLPFLEELNYTPKHKYSFGDEIFAHCQNIATHFDLYPRAMLQTKISGMQWNDESGRWQVATDRGDSLAARFVIMATGMLHAPKLPGIPGIDEFKGKMFHTSRWDYDYSGGTQKGELAGLADKKIGVIGTGATGVQVIPHIVNSGADVYVFQRTPASVGVRGNRETPSDFSDNLQPGWQRQRMDNFQDIIAGVPVSDDLIEDGWTDMFKTLRKPFQQATEGDSVEDLLASFRTVDFEVGEQRRKRVEDTVSDPETAAALKPFYGNLCKRPCFHDEYLPAFNNPNIKLVDTNGRGVERLTENAAIVDGTEYELDCLVFATGYDDGGPFVDRTGFDVTGREGIKLSEKWSKGMRTFHGFQSHGFPNCFIVGMSQSAATANIPHMLREQTEHVAHLIRRLIGGGHTRIEPTLAAENAWVNEVRQSNEVIFAIQQSCTPSYWNNEGKVDEGDSYLSLQHGAGASYFFQLIKAWRGAERLEGVSIT